MLIQKNAWRLFCAIFLLWLCCHTPLQGAVLTGVDPTIINVGTGADTSYLVIDESTLYSTPLEFAYHYTYDSNNPLTGFELLTNVAANSSLGVNTAYSVSVGGNYLISFAFSGNTVAGINAPDGSGTYWSYYLAVGLDGGTTPLLTNQWNYANNGIDARTITPGSWDGWTISSYDAAYNTIDALPSVAPLAVPEPATLPLVFLSFAAVMSFKRWKYSVQKCKS